jgi:hypothetical protein
MITYLNEKTVYCGTSIAEFNKIRNILEINKINYKYGTIDPAHNSYMGPRGVTRSVGGNVAPSSLIYEIKVHKKDYDESMYYIYNAGKK